VVRLSGRHARWGWGGVSVSWRVFSDGASVGVELSEFLGAVVNFHVWVSVLGF
jgi:hypothetical protein